MGPDGGNLGFALAHVLADAVLADTLVDWEVDLAGTSDLEADFAGTAADIAVGTAGTVDTVLERRRVRPPRAVPVEAHCY